MEDESFFRFFLKANLFVKLKVLFIFALSLGILSGAGYVVFYILKLQGYRFHFSAEKKKEPEKKVVQEVPEFTFTYELKNVSMHLTNHKKTRTAYAQFTLILDCASEDVCKRLELDRAKLLDTLYEVGGNFYVDDFRKKEGFDSFKTSLMVAYKERLKAFAPRAIVIRDWVIQ